MDEALKRSKILVVDDDPHGLEFFSSSLEVSGFEVYKALNVPEARRICESIGIQNISVVLTDYRMPMETGIDFVNWLRTKDDALSCVIITAQGEKSIVQASLSAGVFAYLEKPITHRNLKVAIEKAVARTLRLRKFVQSEKDLIQVGEIDYLINSSIPKEIEENISLFYHPLHEVGGDFFNAYYSDEGVMTFVVGDVSGHDIQSGYLSTYFQGMFEGLLAGSAPIRKVLSQFNRNLRNSILAKPSERIPPSLSVNVLQLYCNEEKILNWNFGMLPCLFVDEYGFVEKGSFGNSPIGWLESLNCEPKSKKYQRVRFIYIFTDGLDELAEKIGINSLSLLYILLRNKKKSQRICEESSDDILAFRFQINPSNPLLKLFEPILSEQYSGAEYDHIDQLQSVWRRSIQFAIQDKLGDRLYDLLICIREGMTNAFLHGCEKSEEKFCQLTISCDHENVIVRVRIDDPGRGHEFDLLKRLESLEEEKGKHLGLGIIQHLSDDFELENKGTSLIFDFAVNPDKI